MFQVWVEESFAAGHALRGYRGKCENVHGHNYKVRVTLEGAELNSIGLLCDFKDLKDAIHSTIRKLDHRFLNEVPPFDTLNPSAENLAKYFHEEVSALLAQQAAAGPRNGNPPSAPCRVREVTVWETDNTTATYSE
ncbi:MAG TPA: 6-carboxytetrahydropterin synthase QueD [Terriglobia bacterium]|nr:6-carboxytetrahydropterin synthase QueD [Terriglobia bacterium]